MLEHAGLWGDGDEIEALELIEKRFKLRLADQEIEKCWTVGELFDAIVRAKPELADSKVAWRRMVVALTWFTGLNPRQIGRDTLLIEPKRGGMVTLLLRRFFRRDALHG